MIDAFVTGLVSVVSKNTPALPSGGDAPLLVSSIQQWKQGRVCLKLDVRSIPTKARDRVRLDVRFSFLAPDLLEAQIRMHSLSDFLFSKATTGVLDFGWYRVIAAVARSEFVGGGEPALAGGVWRFELLCLPSAPMRPWYWPATPA